MGPNPLGWGNSFRKANWLSQATGFEHVSSGIHFPLQLVWEHQRNGHPPAQRVPMNFSRTTLSPLVAAPAVSELFGGSFDWNPGSHLKKTNLLCSCRILVREAIRFPISRWFAAFLVVVDSQQSPQGRILHPKKASKKKVLPGPFGCLMMLAARFYPPRWINGTVNHQLGSFERPREHLLHFDHCLVALRQVFGQVLQLRCLLLCRRIPRAEVPSIWIHYLHRLALRPKKTPRNNWWFPRLPFIGYDV